MALLPADRPKTAQYISDYLERRLPIEISTNQFLQTKPFKIIATLVLLVFIFLVGKGLTFSLSRYFYSKGLISFNSNLYTDAKENFQRAILFDNKYSEAYANIATTCKYLNEQACIESNYLKAISLNPSYWESYYSLANYYEDRAIYTKDGVNKDRFFNLSKINYEKAFEKGGVDAIDALNNLARLEVIRFNFNSAISIASKGINLSNDELTLGALFKNRAWALIKLKKFPDARVDLLKSIQNSPDRADAYCLLLQDGTPNINVQSKLYLKNCLKYPSENVEIKELQNIYLSRLINR